MPKLRVGDLVVVRSADEILRTLDDNGALDGLPFMPELVSWCGQAFRVQRQVHKTCVDGHALRVFPSNDVVVLSGPRCDGSGHDGCKHGCRIYWKESWLRPASEKEQVAADPKLDELRARLKIKTDETHYFCQSTELYKSTREATIKGKFKRLRIAASEILSGDLRAFQAVRLFATFYWQKLLRFSGCDDRLRGNQKPTPKQSLNLQPGEIVRVKSQAEIVGTLDYKMSNRGLSLCHEMMRCCGREAGVRARVDRMINEQTGVMREISDTVTLSSMIGCGGLGEECLCYDEPGDCPRGELMYWREIWLERVNK